MTSPRPVTVAVISPLAAVAAGVTRLLSAHPGVEVVDHRRPLDHEPDVTVWDAHALVSSGTAELDRLVAGPGSVVALGHGLRPALVATALEHGACASADISADAETLAEVVLGAAAVTSLVPATTAGTAGTAGAVASRRVGVPAPSRRGTTVVALPDRLGASAGLTPREVDVLTKITQGLSNQEIAEHSYLSINSVKTYIRSAYRRIGVTSRSQAVVWCVQHGFPSTVAA